MGTVNGHAGGLGHAAPSGQCSANHLTILSKRSMVKFAVPFAAAMRGRILGSSAAANDAA
jgi:hypothetical protein